MPKSNEPVTNVIALTEHLDAFHIDDFLSIPLYELREKCSFLIKTSNPEVCVGVTFIRPDTQAGLLLDVAAVRVDFRGTNRVPLSNLASDYEALLVYATVGQASKQFTQRLINWGEFKIALAELAGDVAETQE